METIMLNWPDNIHLHDEPPVQQGSKEAAHSEIWDKFENYFQLKLFKMKMIKMKILLQYL